ncbi:hypothetical protein OZX69_03535 [Lactobacillus sp. ESL0731]|uniref:hypothetical protein n=1 Tax=unclassified Lactobacillus TaxID=2620435 RepID=UPI0023F78FEB|nr:MULTISPECIES: hypothetical protein [unclassified Lactobacillus]WEV51782.1 hypothetical protein OZX63_03535 [Lactobacillus sp. ESL0700]WEV62911.1 hypothetical protein OZX69_03535 [Lactobacillus sp. ESL0731]
MSAIKRLVRVNFHKILLITCGLAILLIILYQVVGITKDLGKVKAIYQLLIPTIFYSFVGIANALFNTLVQPYTNIIDLVRFTKRENWLKVVFGWNIVTSLWSALVSSLVLEVTLICNPAITKIYWSTLLLTILVAFENLLFIQSLILLVYLLVRWLNYFFVNCLGYLMVMILANIQINNRAIFNFLNSKFLLSGEMKELLLQSLIMWGIIILCQNISLFLYERKENL